MAEKNILLLESGQFIGGVIRSLFNPYDQLRVTEAAPTNSREMLQAVARLKPEIIVLDDTVSDDYLTQLLSYMQQSSGKGMRVIVVNTSSNQVEVYEKQQIPVNQTADFIAIL